MTSNVANICALCMPYAGVADDFETLHVKHVVRNAISTSFFFFTHFNQYINPPDTLLLTVNKFRLIN